MVKMLSKVALVLGILALGACATESAPPLEDEAETSQALDGAAALQLKDGKEEQVSSCFTATCQVGLAGNQFCTQLCGDVARCTPPWTTGCGAQPCCVLQ